MKLLVFVGALCFIYYMEYYKFQLIDQLLTLPEQYQVCYRIFPWSTDQSAVNSQSSLLWIYFHLILALVHVTLAYWRLIWDEPMLRFYFNVSFVLFALHVVYNLHHFGAYTSGEAALINGGLMILLVGFYPGKQLEFPQYWCYLLALTSPVIFELILKIN